MACGCNKKRTKKEALLNAKKAVKNRKRRPMPLVTIRRKSLKKSAKK
jgi:hypothetical protein